MLVLEESHDGQVTHSWMPLKDFDLANHQYQMSRMGADPRIVRVSRPAEEYCRGRRKQCEEDCFASSRPIQVGHLIYPRHRGPWRINKSWWCPEACGILEDMCRRGMGDWAEESVAEFTEIGPAVDWVRNHREEILVGSIVVIAGVAFVAVMASGGGALFLVPLLVLAENTSGKFPASRIAEATR
ncbi:hypothetical protein [Archangium lipolyticum]|uniref:hypothetical protein n=1 Tax=Archangium lipolyticum TaxID=2970465 RepID=UPI002149DDC0|nr:hypothetical protein [Archangium lipolyticum]